MYIYQRPGWPRFTWDDSKITPLLTNARHNQGRMLGKMEALGFGLREEASLQTLTQDVVKTSEIEGEVLDVDQVRSSIARRLGMEIVGLIASDRHVDGVVEMMLDATQRCNAPLSDDRLFGWHNSLFPTGRSGMHKIVVGNWRNNSKADPMQVVSGAMGREIVHFQAPDSEIIAQEMVGFIEWFNSNNNIDPVLKAGIAHLWFVTLHPFDDGNGRIARAIADMQLTLADHTAQRFYSMSAQIRLERKRYYDVLEQTQKGTLDITEWLSWFLDCYERALSNTDETIGKVLRKAKFWESPQLLSINERQRLMLNKLLEGFEGKLTSSKWAQIAKCSQDTATRDIQNLVERGVMLKEKGGGRSTSYLLNI
ncbi:Adenosine monophosphate-protein transferase SoFic [compost metagenome]